MNFLLSYEKFLGTPAKGAFGLKNMSGEEKTKIHSFSRVLSESKIYFNGEKFIAVKYDSIEVILDGR